MKSYRIRESIPIDISHALSPYPPLLQDLLYARNITDKESAEAFLHPSYEQHTYNPYDLKDMDKVVERIVRAIQHGETIAIYSDYDADGIPGAVVLSDFFKKINYEKIIHYIPLRNEEGFGLNPDAIHNLADQNVTLLITIDCGITDVSEIELANTCGIDVIVTDHHIPTDVLPPAFAIINPKQEGCLYPEKMLCGSGVIFKVVQALIQNKDINFPPGQEKWMLDMVGLATLSDMVPLLGENRTLAYFGMTVFRKSPRIGLQKLLSLLGIDQRTISEDDIAFMITPRINAASRMGIPLDAFKLLSTTDDVEAGVLAKHLNDKNDERKTLVAQMVKEIKKKIHDREGTMRNVLVLGNPNWKPSLLGLVANSFSDEHNRPVFLWGREGSNGSTVIKGSCRSGGGINIVKLMEKTAEAFLDYGGHAGAGGFTVSEENIHTLEDSLNRSYDQFFSDSSCETALLVDKKISLDDVSWDTYRSVEVCAPFGFENPKPLFVLEQVEISGVKQFGKEKNHLEIRFKNSKDKDVVAIGFFMHPEKFNLPIEVGARITLVATLEKSTFRNFPELRLRIVDIF